MSTEATNDPTTLMPAAEETFDLVVLGAGPGGYVAALRAAQLGGRVAIVEKQYIGGTCLNVGCIPSKALLHIAEEYSKFSHLANFGIMVQQPPTFDMAKAVQYKNKVVKQLTGGVAGLLKANGVVTVNGRGIVEEPGRVIVDQPGGTRRILLASKIILATGSVSIRPPFPGIDGHNVIFSTEALDLQQVPKSLVCIGGGVIAVEFACLFQALGSKVTIVEMLPSMIAYEEPEVVALLEKIFKRRGIDVHTNTRVESIGDKDGHKVVTAVGPEGPVSFDAEYVLCAVGRAPNPDGLKGLVDHGLAMDRNRVIVDGRMETSIPGIYAIGDLSGKTQLAHVGMAEGEVAAENAMGHESSMDYTYFPRPVYTFPEIASVGLTEAQAKEMDSSAHAGTFPWAANGKALAGDDAEGMVKVVLGKHGELLGAAIIGPDATNLITEYTLAMRSELTATEIVNTIHPHPTLSEALREAVLAADKLALHIFQRR
jgi:dihydrolipoamide dehydrogenase